MSTVHSAADEVLVAPSFGGWSGTYLTVPPGISILLRYLSKMLVQPTKNISFYGGLLVKEGLENDNFVALLNKAHEGTQHPYRLSVATLPAPPRAPLPSFAPLVIVTSVSGFRVLPKEGE